MWIICGSWCPESVPVLRHYFWADGPCIVLEPNSGASRGSSTSLGSSLTSATKSLGFWFCLDQVFHRETIFFIVTVTTSPFAVNQGPRSCSSPLWRLVLLWSEIEHHIHPCFIYICNFRLRVYTFLLVFFDSLAGKAFSARSIKLCLVDNQRSYGVAVAGFESCMI